MKSIFLKVLCGLGLVFGLAFFGLAAESEAAASIQPPETTQPPSGDIDSRLVGVWAYRFLGLHGTDTYIYNFKSDGTFEYFVQQNRFVGSYYTSDGKIYMSNIIYIQDNTKWGEDKVVEYTFGTDQSGSYLQATKINRDGTYFELKSNSMKYHTEN